MSGRLNAPFVIGDPLRLADAPAHAGGSAVDVQPASVDVAIIGAGIIGLAIGWRLAAAGLEVALFERGEAGCGATCAATGMLAAATELEAGGSELLALALESQHLWASFRGALESEAGIDVDYRREGTLTVALGRDEVARLQFRYDLQARCGLATRWLDGARARELEPALRPSVTAGIFCADDHQVDPRRLVPALHRAIVGLGGKILEHVPVLSIDIAGGRVEGVVTPEGFCRAPTVIVANGAWAGTRELAGDVLALPIRPLKGQALALRATASTGLPAHVVWTEQVHLAPKAGGRLIVGSTVEESGFDRAVTAGGILALLDGARRALPSIEDMEVEAIWTGLRPTSDDDAPILGASGVAGLVLATGHHRNGILLAPVTAKAIHDLVVTGAMAGAACGFGLDRFAGSRPRAGAAIGTNLLPQEDYHAAQRER